MPRTVTSPSREAASPALQVPNRPDAKIALRGVQLRSRVSGMSQRTSVFQTFINQEPEAIEAVYTFPLPEGAAVCGFEVVTADRVLTGQIEESEQAVDQYEQAVGQGHGAFLMEQDRPDVFTVRVGNLKPRQAATIRLTYVCPLEFVDKSIRVAFPTTIAPRYVTDTAADPLEAMVDGEALNPPHVLHVPYGLSMEVEIDLGRQLAGVSSPSHTIRVETTDGREGQAQGVTRVTLAGGVTEMNRDIVLSVSLRKEHEPCVQCERGPDGANYLAVTFVPEFDLDELADGSPAASETIFVLDCSGSMQGDSIRQATAALELCLRGMNEGDTFNICRFGSTFELMASEPLRYSQQTLDKAVSYVRRGADLGGTELYAPLEAILRQPPIVGKVRQVVLLTDGQVSNEPACIDLARRNRLRNRIFSFGIGPACSSHLVKGLARATGGAAEFITTGERIDDKVLRTFSRLASPFVTDVSIDWDGAEVQTLAELPPVFDGDVLAVFGRSPGRAPARVTLSCTTASGPKSWKVAVPPLTEASRQDRLIATMWARRTIQSLEEVNSLAGARSRPAVKSREREMVVNLSKEFGLLSSLTTFIAVEHRTVEERNEGRPALRRVPVMLAAGWGGVQAEQTRGRPGGAAAMAMYSALPAAIPPSPATQQRSRRSLVKRLFGTNADDGSARSFIDAAISERKKLEERILTGRPPSPSPAPCASAPPDNPARDLVDLENTGSGLLDLTRESDGTSLGAVLDEIAPSGPGNGRGNLLDLLTYQLADGSFGGGADLGGHAGSGDTARWWPKVKQALADLGGQAAANDLVLRTVIAILVMTSKFAGDEALWRRARGKSLRFVARTVGKSVPEVEQWLTDLQAKLVAP
jgi:Ca-activated chloride channel family protein